MATLIKADGTQTEIQPQNGTDFSLEELQKYVDGYPGDTTPQPGG